MSLFNYECDEVKRMIDEVSPNYPQLTTFEKEWIFFHKYHYIPGVPVELECQEVIVNPTGTVQNAIPYSYKSAVLKGSTKYRDIDTGEILETFEEGRNLELVSVNMPVLTTSNEDGTKTNILTVNEEVELRGIDKVKDEMNLLTGELTQRIDEVVLDGSERWALNKPLGDGSFYQFVSNTVNAEKISQQLVICDKLISKTDAKLNNIIWLYNGTSIVLHSSCRSIKELKTWLQQNPLTVQYKLATPVVKTVALTKLNKPYEGTNHYHLMANIPCEAILEVPVISTGEQTLQEINNY